MRTILASVLLLASLATAPTLSVTPRHDFSYDGKENAEFTYHIRFENAQPRMICTGWRYPIADVDQSEWPGRSSCRLVTARLVVEYWGGRYYPLPYIGEYMAFVQVYVGGRPAEGTGQTFTVLEGIPR